MELLAVIEAEEQADALITEAQLRKEQAIAGALREREALLAGITQPQVPEPQVKPLRPHIERLAAAARRNKAKAIHAILEEIDAA